MNYNSLLLFFVVLLQICTFCPRKVTITILSYIIWCIKTLSCILVNFSFNIDHHKFKRNLKQLGHFLVLFLFENENVHTSAIPCLVHTMRQKNLPTLRALDFTYSNLIIVEEIVKNFKIYCTCDYLILRNALS